MRNRREFIKLVGKGTVGGLLARSLPPLGLGALLLTPRPALAAVRLDPNDPTANFTYEGQANGFVAGNVLAIKDASVSDVANFFAGDADAPATGPDLDVVATFQVLTFTLAGADAGVRFVINEGGLDKAVVGACIIKGGQRGIGLAAGNLYADESNYPVFVAVDWTSVTTIRIRRTQAGAEIVEVNGVAPSPRAFLERFSLPLRTRTNGTVEFGSASAEALVEVGIEAFESKRVGTAVAGLIEVTALRLRDAASGDQVRLRADFSLGAGADGINPSTEDVTIRLSTPSGGQFYPSPSTDFNPIRGFEEHGTAPRRRWSVSQGERERTGLERFDIDESPNNSGSHSLRDRNANLSATDYSTVNVKLTIGDDELSGSVQLAESPPGSGSWREI